MKSFDKLILLICAVMIGIGVLFNVVFPLLVRDDERLYVVEINRFMEYGHIQSAFVEQSEVLSSMRFFPIGEDAELLNEMFTRNSRRYIVRPLFNDGELYGFFQFGITDTQNDSFAAVRAFVNGVLVVITMMSLVILLYIRQQIIVPFNEISHLPTLLSKGNVKKGIPESKSRYFGNFIWGLNMMSETLSAHNNERWNF